VHNIADVIMLRRTLVTLLDSDVTVLMTSNYPPERLLPVPTFHEVILAAVEAIRDQLDVIHRGGVHDWRTASTQDGKLTREELAKANKLPRDADRLLSRLSILHSA
jgi:cell division protein ZapE